MLLDCAVLRDKLAMKYNASPVLPLRKLFDSGFYNKKIMWGSSGFPRPIAEILEGAWVHSY